MIVFCIILICLVILLGYTTYNLLRKNEKAEDIITSYEEYIKGLTSTISTADKKLKEIDQKGLFDSDDEIGWFFGYVKEIQTKLNRFTPNQ
jgi:uncharacterized membrane protein YukC